MGQLNWKKKKNVCHFQGKDSPSVVMGPTNYSQPFPPKAMKMPILAMATHGSNGRTDTKMAPILTSSEANEPSYLHDGTTQSCRAPSLMQPPYSGRRPWCWADWSQDPHCDVLYMLCQRHCWVVFWFLEFLCLVNISIIIFFFLCQRHLHASLLF